MTLKRAYSLLTITDIVSKAAGEPGADDAPVIIKGIASTPTPDRHGDIVEPAGLEFKEEIPLLWQHRHDKPVGIAKLGKPGKNGVPFSAELPRIKNDGELKKRVDEAIDSVKSGLVRAVSIGFSPKEYSRIEDGGLRFISAEVVELSLVTIPANQEATISYVKSIDSETLLAASGAKEVPGKNTGVTVKPKNATIRKESRMDLTAQITSLKNAIAVKSAELEALVNKSAETGETFDAEQAESFDTLTQEIEAAEKQIERFEKALALTAKAAKPVAKAAAVSASGAAAARSAVVVKNTAAVEKGVGFAQFAICLGAAKGNLMQAKEIAQTRFPDNHELNIAVKAAVAAGSTTDPAWAGPLVDSYQRFAGDFVEFLRPQTILGKFGTGSVPSLRRVPFNISIPAQISGGEGYWVGEGANKPLTKFDFSEVTLRFAKVANIAVLTEELLRLSNPSAEILVRDALADALRARLDVDFVDPAKAEVANVSPASITNGLTPVVSEGVDAEAVRKDIKALFGAFIAANNAPTNGVFIMSATLALALSLMQNPLGQSEFPGVGMNGGTFFGLPVIVSQHVAGNVVILANASDILLADDGMVAIDASREASLQMDSAPSAGATTLVSMFQTNSVAIRAERWITWKRRRTGSVAILTDVDWGGTESV
ncbi:major capsid protein [Rhizobium phage RHph_X2_26]|nr:major capsid protein [Rhizobium phage RHph_X2_26]